MHADNFADSLPIYSNPKQRDLIASQIVLLQTGYCRFNTSSIFFNSRIMQETTFLSRLQPTEHLSHSIIDKYVQQTNWYLVV